LPNIASIVKIEIIPDLKIRRKKLWFLSNKLRWSKCSFFVDNIDAGWFRCWVL